MLTWPLNVAVLSDGEVTLRAHMPGDVDAIVEMCRDPQMVRWTSVPDPYERPMAEQHAFEHGARGWDEGTSRLWAVEVDGRFAGNVELRGTPIADVGFALHPWARGRGVMVRALRLACDWGFTDGDVEIVHWRAHPGNEPSLRVAHHAGFTLHGLQPGLLHERGLVLDAWTASLRFGDPPVPRHRWAESTTLRGDRVVLRAPSAADDPRTVEAMADADVLHWLDGTARPFTPANAVNQRDKQLLLAATGERATWTIADPTSDTLLGSISLMDMNATSGDAGEIGYWVHPDARGRGVASEALRLVVAHALDRDGLDRRRLAVYAAHGNGASNAVARSAGFSRFGRQRQAERLGDGTFDDLVGYEVLR